MISPGAPSVELVTDAKDRLVEFLPVVESVAILAVGEHEYGNRCQLSIVLSEGVNRAPPNVCRELAKHDLGIVDVSSQGDQLVVSAA